MPTFIMCTGFMMVMHVLSKGSISVDILIAEYLITQTQGRFSRVSREGDNADHDVEDHILDQIERDPKSSTRALAVQFEVSQWKVWKTIKLAGLHPYHFTRVQALEERDGQARVDFARWLLNNDVEDPNLFSRILWTDESTFTREGIFNTLADLGGMAPYAPPWHP
ncbi:hypothetical protein NQ318_006320 [Aromia moschata]|uniref:Transposase n=1 Tax=Aromia moschata TaxID=1265417 RepID=A0AAV8Y018_9CUCU|nr:hypothetical protein NQ318_006320 [Aromia moschata]